ncbi:hypothetical protein BKA62DRAFT_704703 [Auriculariales sp. MPI-PUGE-AT-0066]|nr:hypothetical protein BKA62DRAFT_202383 [Auriculariales sp. MPI-PUGE-AT-0066]KAH7100984.1 hypothetical protein BKA62DRAFT_704703 [Auriculariales sp. MPI-PUGE-AT-0066]
MQSRTAATLVALFFFSLLVVAGPLAVDKHTDLAVRTASCGGNCSDGAGTSISTQLQLVLALCLDLQTQINSVLTVVAQLHSSTNISSHCSQIVILITACVKAVTKLNISAVAFVSLSTSDQACVKNIAQVCAEIIFGLQSHISVFSVLVLGNVWATLALASALVSLCSQLSLCVYGFLGVVTQICTGLGVQFSTGLCLTAVLRLLSL